MQIDKATSRILIVAISVLAAIGLLGTLYLLATGGTETNVSVFVALAGVPMGAVAALATTRNGPAEPIIIKDETLGTAKNPIPINVPGPANTANAPKPAWTDDAGIPIIPGGGL